MCDTYIAKLTHLDFINKRFPINFLPPARIKICVRIKRAKTLCDMRQPPNYKVQVLFGKRRHLNYLCERK